mgnify:CR=1 FL=1
MDLSATNGLRVYDATTLRAEISWCLGMSEPGAGSDPTMMRTNAKYDPATNEYILNGEKKWATSGAISNLFTVMAKQKFIDPKTGKESERVSALVCHPEMEGVDIYQKNRSKCGIRGTWQARIRFNNVHVPKENLLHIEGKGLNVALTCLNYGRCTLSAGMLGGARRALARRQRRLCRAAGRGRQCRGRRPAAGRVRAPAPPAPGRLRRGSADSAAPPGAGRASPGA